MNDEPLTENLGKLEFSTIYVFAESTLWVNIIKVVNASFDYFIFWLKLSWVVFHEQNFW